MKESIDNFLNYLSVEKGYSGHTISAYRNDLTGLADFTSRESAKTGASPTWTGFGRQNMLSYMLDLKERGYVATTMARKVAAARSFFGPTELPVGVLTALLGVPVLLWLLFRRRTYLRS